jgi:hypothetical protein
MGKTKYSAAQLRKTLAQVPDALVDALTTYDKTKDPVIGHLLGVRVKEGDDSLEFKVVDRTTPDLRLTAVSLIDWLNKKGDGVKLFVNDCDQSLEVKSFEVGKDGVVYLDVKIVKVS